MKKFLLNFAIVLISLTAIFILLIFFEPLKHLNWGKIQYAQQGTVTVTGEASSQQKNQVASFTAGVEAVNDDKQTAIDEVNEKMEELIENVKNFGVKDEDIQTQNMSIYQQEDSILEEGRRVSKKGQWRVNNSIIIKLRDADKASDLTVLLSDSGATNVYGPNFTIEETSDYKADLLKDAIEDARQKAQKIADASGQKLGKVITVNEGYSSSSDYYPMLKGLGEGGGAAMEPGSSKISTSVTVVFELK